jgi:hypothetical protein
VRHAPARSTLSGANCAALLRILSAVLTNLLVASSVASAHAWYPLACCGGEDCGAADIIVYAGENDWDQQLRAFDDHLMGLYAADKAAPSSPYKPVQPPEQMQSMPCISPRMCGT